MAAWEFHLLGPLVVLRAGQPPDEPAWRSRQVRSILKMLLVRPGAVVATEQLLHALWPDDDEASARRRLHVRVSGLRRALGADGPRAIVTVEGGYRFQPAPDFWIDSVAFEAQMEAARTHQDRRDLAPAVTAYEAARQLYRGDFLAEDLYAPWATAERERLRETYLMLLTELAECYAQQGQYRRAISSCRRALSLDDGREALYVRLMLYYYYAGERTQAVRAYQRCRQVLAEQLGVTPLPATSRLAAQIRAGTLWAAADAPRYPPPAFAGRLFDIPYVLSQPPFTGRQPEYAWLVERWQSHQTGVILIQGETGVGKTRLAMEFLAYAAGQNATCRSLEPAATPLPFATVAQLALSAPAPPPALARSHWAALAAVSPALTPPEDVGPLPRLSPDQAAALLPAALGIWLRHALPPATVLLLDDAHQADGASLQLLAGLSDHLFVLLAARTQPLADGRAVAAVVRPGLPQDRWHALALSPLPETAVIELVTRLAGRALPGLAAQLWSQTGGNPFFLVTALHHLFETGDLAAGAHGVWEVTHALPPTLPPSLQQLVEARLAQLSRDGRRVFDLAAVAGGSFDFAVMQHAGRFAEAHLLDVLDDLTAAGLLVEPRAAGRPEFVIPHRVYLTVAYETLPAARRRRAHHRMAAALEATSPRPQALAPVLAEHYLAAGIEESAYRWLLVAGDVAADRFAHGEAMAFYRRALALRAGEAGPVWQRLGSLTHHLARYEESLQFHQRALACWQASGDRPRQVETQYALAENYRELSQYEAARAAAAAGLTLARELASATAAVEATVPATALVARGHIILSNALRSGQLAGAADVEQHLQVALALAQPAGLAQLVGEANFWLGVVAINRGDAAAALLFDRAALDAFAHSGRPGWLAIAHNNAAYHALLAGEASLALETAGRGLALAREIGSRHAEGWLLSTLGEVQTHLGRLADAAETLQAGVAHARRWGPPRLLPGMLHDVARVALARAAWPQAEAALEEAMSLAETEAPQFIPRLQLTMAELRLAQGACLPAHALARTALARAEEKGQEKLVGEAWRVLGEIRARRGETAAASRAFARSFHILSRLENWLEVARTQASWARWQQDAGAAPVLAQARRTFHGCAARLDLARWTGR